MRNANNPDTRSELQLKRRKARSLAEEFQQKFGHALTSDELAQTLFGNDSKLKGKFAMPAHVNLLNYFFTLALGKAGSNIELDRFAAALETQKRTLKLDDFVETLKKAFNKIDQGKQSENLKGEIQTLLSDAKVFENNIQ